MRAALGFVLCTGTALAQDAGPRVRLAWNAPAGCASEPAVLAEVRRVLGGPPSRDATAKADVEEAAGRRYRERLSTEVGGVTGEQTLEADSCEELAAATGLILAWTIDPRRAALQAAAASSPPSSAPAPPPVAPPRPPIASLPPARIVVQALVAADVVGDVGTLPGAEAAGRFTLGLRVGSARVEGSFIDTVSGDAHGTGAFAKQGASLHPLEGTLRGCYLWQLASRLELGPCLGAGITHVRSDGFGETTPFKQQLAQGTMWVDLTGDATAVLAVAGPFALRASVGVDAPLARPEFVIEVTHDHGQMSSTTIHQAAPAAGRATLGVEVRFP